MQVAIILLLFLNILVTVFLNKKISDRLNSLKLDEKNETFQRGEKDIHTILSDRLFDIQNRKYSVQQRFRDRD